MIICITAWHIDPKTRRKSPVVSHGIERETGRRIVLPSEHPKDIGAEFNDKLREWVIF